MKVYRKYTLSNQIHKNRLQPIVFNAAYCAKNVD